MAGTPSKHKLPIVTTPLKRRPPPSFGVCGCFFGADRCEQCCAANRAAKAAEPKPDDAGTFSSLPDDCIERIAGRCGSDLPALASVNKAVRRIIRPALWRQAYEEACGEPVTCGEALPPELWRACLLRDPGLRP